MADANPEETGIEMEEQLGTTNGINDGNSVTSNGIINANNSSQQLDIVVDSDYEQRIDDFRWQIEELKMRKTSLKVSFENTLNRMIYPVLDEILCKEDEQKKTELKMQALHDEYSANLAEAKAKLKALDPMHNNRQYFATSDYYKQILAQRDEVTKRERQCQTHSTNMQDSIYNNQQITERDCNTHWMNFRSNLLPPYRNYISQCAEIDVQIKSIYSEIGRLNMQYHGDINTTDENNEEMEESH